jgi:hypothetical protein
VIEFSPHESCDEHRDRECRCKNTEIRCVASAEWPGLYHGVVDTRLGPLGHSEHHRGASFKFSAEIGEVLRVFLLCRYEVVTPVCDGASTVLQDRRVRRWESEADRGLRPSR